MTTKFHATWIDSHGNTYEQPIELNPEQDPANELSAHLMWVCDNHDITSYTVHAV